MLSHNNTNHRQKTQAETWAQGTALEHFHIAGVVPDNHSFTSCSCSVFVLFILVFVCLFIYFILKHLMLKAKLTTLPPSVCESERL